MKRAPIVLVATAAGLAGVLSFHTSSSPVVGGTSLGASSGTSSTSNGSSAGTGTSGGATTTTTTSPPSSAGTGASTSTSTSTPSATKTATGVEVNYNYGIMAVAATAKGGKITAVKIASINEGGNQLSQSIDQQSIPLLEQEVLKAQSANIQSVSGASYTSAGFIQSLQSALGKLGIK